MIESLVNRMGHVESRILGLEDIVEKLIVNQCQCLILKSPRKEHERSLGWHKF